MYQIVKKKKSWPCLQKYKFMPYLEGNLAECVKVKVGHILQPGTLILDD